MFSCIHELWPYHYQLSSCHHQLSSWYYQFSSRHHLDLCTWHITDNVNGAIVQHFAKYPALRAAFICVFVCLLLCKIVDFCKVYWSPRFITLQNRRFLQSILGTAVCYFAKSSIFQNMLVTAVCLSVSKFCLRTMYRPQYWSDRSDFVPADVFWSKDHGKCFSWKSAW